MKNTSSKIQKMSLPASSGVLKKIESFNELKNQLFTLMPTADISDNFLKDISIVLNKAAITYSIFADEIDKESISRDASMICGSSYVSEAYPQPVDLKGSAMFPVLQIDLEWLGTITERKFTNEIFQLWWSSNDSDATIVMIPKSDVDLSSAVPLVVAEDVADEVENWIPYDWLCHERSNCYQIIGCANIGITYPDFEILADTLIDEYSEKTNFKKIEVLINKLCNCSSFNTPKSGSKKILFNTFGFYKSHSCSPWEYGTDICFLHTPNWASGMMDANIFMNIDNEGVIFDFNFGFGR